MDEAFNRLKSYLSLRDAPLDVINDLYLIERKYNKLKAENRIHMMYLSQAPTINVYYDRPEGGTQE